MSDAARNQQASLLRNAAIELKNLQMKLDAIERARTEPIAVIGIGSAASPGEPASRRPTDASCATAWTPSARSRATAGTWTSTTGDRGPYRIVVIRNRVSRRWHVCHGVAADPFIRSCEGQRRGF
jgi:hypothetical protein